MRMVSEVRKKTVSQPQCTDSLAHLELSSLAPQRSNFGSDDAYAERGICCLAIREKQIPRAKKREG